jgi:uncharacterized membrane protein
MEAFSDGVIAIIITIMVLELHPPHETGIAALRPLIPTFAAYAFSFLYLGIYWNNHHHLLQAIEHVDGKVLWANLHLLFWLSLVPFVTAWMGQTRYAPVPVALYGAVLLLSALAYTILTRALISLHGRQSVLASALGRDVKGYVSLALYVVALGLAFVAPLAACAIYVLVAIIWLVPDRRIERKVQHG